jgi:PAS domain-containing protein
MNPVKDQDKTEHTLEERDRGERRGGDELFRLMIEGVKDYAIFMLDPEGCVASWNAGAERMKG